MVQSRHRFLHRVPVQILRLMMLIQETLGRGARIGKCFNELTDAITADN